MEKGAIVQAKNILLENSYYFIHEVEKWGGFYSDTYQFTILPNKFASYIVNCNIWTMPSY